MLSESEEKYRMQFEGALDAIFVADAETGIIIDCNRAASELVGRKKSELVGKHQRILHPPEEIEGDFSRTFKQHLKEKEGQVVETQVITKKGEIKDVVIKANVFELRGKKLIQGIFRDITEQKKMEERLLESEERLRNLYENIPDSLAVFVGREGRLLEYNKAFKKRTGYTDEELKDKKFLDFVHHDDRAIIQEKYRTKYPEEAFPLVYEMKEMNKKGEALPTEVSVNTYKKKGKVIGIEVLHRDITERKRAEEALRRSEEEAKRLLEFQNKVIDTAAVWVNLLDVKGNVILWNRAAELISGYSREEVIGHKKLWEWLYPDPNYRANIFAIGKEITERGKRLEDYHTIIRCKDGSLKTISWYSTNVLDEKGKPAGSIAVGIDVTVRKAMEKKLQEYAEHLEEMVEERTRKLKESQERLLKAEKLAAIGELATMVGHDLRNPLTSLQNACYYLKMKFGASKDEKLRKIFEVTDREINYANKIVKDLLDFSRVKKPELKKVDLILSIQDALAQLKFPENIRITSNFSEGPAIEADPDQLRRVFQNIALNGIQAMPHGGELTVSTRKNSDFVEVTFMDTGVGISEENMDKLFTPLFTTKAQGVGLGLAICKNLIEGHNGRIEVRSKVGEGSTFTVKLPIHQTKGGEKQK